MQIFTNLTKDNYLKFQGKMLGQKMLLGQCKEEKRGAFYPYSVQYIHTVHCTLYSTDRYCTLSTSMDIEQLLKKC